MCSMCQGFMCPKHKWLLVRELEKQVLATFINNFDFQVHEGKSMFSLAVSAAKFIQRLNNLKQKIPIITHSLWG